MISSDILRERASDIFNSEFSTDLRIKARKLLELADMFDIYTDMLIEEDELVRDEIINRKNHHSIKRKKDIISGKKKYRINSEVFDLDLLYGNEFGEIDERVKGKLKKSVFAERDSEWLTSKGKKVIKVLDKETNKVRKYGIDIYEINPGYEPDDPEWEEAIYRSLYGEEDEEYFGEE